METRLFSGYFLLICYFVRGAINEELLWTGTWTWIWTGNEAVVGFSRINRANRNT